jgi:hypothetical protein
VIGKLFTFSDYTAGDWLSVLGLVVTLIGFAITIFNVVRSRTAAEEAERAVAKVREDILRIDTVAEFSAAIAAMDEIKRLQREGAWSVLPDRYADLRKSLISIKSANKDLPAHYMTAIQSSIQHFRGIETIIEKSLAAKKIPSNATRLNTIMSEQVDELHGILTEIKSQIGA